MIEKIIIFMNCWAINWAPDQQSATRLIKNDHLSLISALSAVQMTEILSCNRLNQISTKESRIFYVLTLAINGSLTSATAAKLTYVESL